MSERGISPIIGIVLLVAITILLIAVAGVTFVSLGETTLTSATVHSQGNYDVVIDDEGTDTLDIRLQGFNERAPDTEFELVINGVQTYRWDGQDTVELECLYPGDRIYIASRNDDTSRRVSEHFVNYATECPEYSTFPEKFQHSVVAGNSYVTGERYAFGLSIVPNGNSVAYDSNGDNDQNLGKISLANGWHHIKKYDKEIEGVEPPVFVVVMVDNVHWEDIPDPSAHASVSGQYNWTDEPPSGLDPGANSYDINGNSIDPNPGGSEPTNDVYMLFKPGCDESTVIFLENNAGYENDVYLDGTKVIDDASSASEDETFSAPGVECRGDTSW